MPDQKITVYGTDWCHDTKSTRLQLDNLGIAYRYVNIERDPQGDAWVKEQNNGKRKMPTVDLDGQILSVPSEDELMDAVNSKGLAK